MKYVVIIEKGPNNLSAYLPDLPGCVSTGGNVDEVSNLLKLAGIARDLPEDFAAQHDHYIHGTPKR